MNMLQMINAWGSKIHISLHKQELLPTSPEWSNPIMLPGTVCDIDKSTSVDTDGLYSNRICEKNKSFF